MRTAHAAIATTHTIAASKSPELKARFDREREELEGTEEAAEVEQGAGSGEEGG